MQATLTFNLPEDDAEHKHALKGIEYYSCLWDIDQRMRSLLKHGNDYSNVEVLAQDIRDMISGRVNLYND